MGQNPGWHHLRSPTKTAGVFLMFVPLILSAVNSYVRLASQLSMGTSEKCPLVISRSSQKSEPFATMKNGDLWWFVDFLRCIPIAKNVYRVHHGDCPIEFHPSQPGPSILSSSKVHAKLSSTPREVGRPLPWNPKIIRARDPKQCGEVGG